MTRIMTANTATEIHVQMTYVVQVSVSRKGTLESTTGRNFERTPAKATALRRMLPLTAARKKPLKMLDERGRAMLDAEREGVMRVEGWDR